MKQVYLLAYPAGHSISPEMHNAAFAALGVAARYEALEVAPEGLEAAVAALRADDTLGANVTIPHKRAVMPLLDALSEAARAIGAVNTIVNQGGLLWGDNTDAAGFVRALTDDAGYDPHGKRALVLGAGGSARAVAYALLRAGVSELQLYNRTVDKAHTLAADLRAFGEVKVVEGGLETTVRAAHLLVNTTSVGMTRHGHDPDTSPLPQGVLPDGGLVCDIVYRPQQTRLLREAKVAGLKTQGGLAMLVYQGAASLTAWTGLDAPTEVMREAAQALLV